MVDSGGAGPGPGPGPGTGQTLTVDRTQVTTLYHTGTFPPANDTVKVTSAGASVTIAAQAVTDSGGPWLSVTAQPASTPASLSIGYSIDGLAPGTYTGRITVTSGSSTPLIIPVTLAVVVDSNVQLQATPPSLSFSSVTGGADPAAQSIAVTVAGLEQALSGNGVRRAAERQVAYGQSNRGRHAADTEGRGHRQGPRRGRV